MYFKLDVGYISHFLYFFHRFIKQMLLEEYWLHTLFLCYSWWSNLLCSHYCSTLWVHGLKLHEVCKINLLFTWPFSWFLSQGQHWMIQGTNIWYAFCHFILSPLNVISFDMYKAMLT